MVSKAEAYHGTDTGEEHTRVGDAVDKTNKLDRLIVLEQQGTILLTDVHTVDERPPAVRSRGAARQLEVCPVSRSTRRKLRPNSHSHRRSSRDELERPSSRNGVEERYKLVW